MFNDKLFLRKSGPASWTHLQVRKADVLREFSAPTVRVATAQSLDDLPKMQSYILELAKQLCTLAKAPPQGVRQRRKQKLVSIGDQFGGPNRLSIISFKTNA
jgi:hypothetical protein